MKIALCFRFTQTFCLRYAQEGAIFSRWRIGKQKFKRAKSDKSLNKQAYPVATKY
jgi:hypothetical protein